MKWAINIWEGTVPEVEPGRATCTLEVTHWRLGEAISCVPDVFPPDIDQLFYIETTILK
jgi:hypothetical protein